MKEISPWRIQRTVENENGKSDYIDAQYMRVPESEETHLRDYWNILIKRRRLVILVFLAVLGFGAYIISSATPMYTAGATIRIEPQYPMVTRIEEVLSLQTSGTYDYYLTEFALLKSRRLAAKVITELGLESNRAFTGIRVISPSPLKWLRSWFFGSLQSFLTYVSQLSRRESKQEEESLPVRKERSPPPREESNLNVNPNLVNRYLSYLKVNPVRRTRLVQVLFTTPDPHLSQELANTHAAAFIRMNLETRFELTKEAREYLEKKLLELKAKLEQSEIYLNDFRKRHGLVSLAKSENIVIDRMIAINQQLTTSSIKRIELESLHRMLKNQKLRNLSEIINNGMIQNHKTNIETLEVEQARLSTIFKPNHPRMLELGKQITESHQRLNLEVAGIVRRIESDYAVARQREESLKLEAERQKKAAINLKELGVKYTILQGDVDSNRNLYNGILVRVNETKISNDLPVSNMQITETARAPGYLSSLGKQLKLFLATAFGALFLAVGLAFFLAYCDSTVRTPEDVWRDVSLNTLGIVPDMRTLSRRLYGYNGQHKLPVAREAHRQLKRGHSLSKELIASQHPLSITSESYYTIRTALLRLQPENPPQAILLTSPGPHEGKTLTTLNLGISLAQAGYAVLVMDADLHQGICHKMLGLKNHKGLTNILTGNLTPEEGIQKAPIDGLSLLCRGVLPRNPADLLGSNKMKEVLDLIRASFDFILIDSPPVIAVTDAAVLSAMSDGVLLVLNGRETKAAAARHAIERLAAVRANVLGVVLNGVDMRNSDYTDYRSYYTAYTSQSKEKADI